MSQARAPRTSGSTHQRSLLLKHHCWSYRGTALMQNTPKGFSVSVLGESPCWVLQEQSPSTKGLPGWKVSSEGEGGGRNDKSFLLKFSPQMDLAEPGSADLKARFIIRAGCCLKGEKIFEVGEWWKGLPPPLPHTHFLRVVAGRCSTALSQEITWQIKQLCVLAPSFYLNI